MMKSNFDQLLELVEFQLPKKEAYFMELKQIKTLSEISSYLKFLILQSCNLLSTHFVSRCLNKIFR